MHEGEHHVWGPALLPGLTAMALLWTSLLSGLMGATLPLLGLSPPSDRWGIRGLEPRTTQKSRVGLCRPPHTCTGTGSHTCRQIHAHAQLFHTHAHAWRAGCGPQPGPVGPLVFASLSPLPRPPFGGNRSIFVNPGIMSLFSTVSGGTRHRGTSSRTRGLPLGKWVQEPSPSWAARTVAGHPLHCSGLQAGHLRMGTRRGAAPRAH